MALKSIRIHTVLLDAKFNAKTSLNDGSWEWESETKNQIHKLFQPSCDMESIIGKHPYGVTRHQFVQKLCKYLKGNKLQITDQKQYF